jgi:hypothetical protein
LIEEAGESWYQFRIVAASQAQLEPVCHSAKVGKGTGVHLLHRPAAVELYRCFGDAYIASNLVAKGDCARPQS